MKEWACIQVGHHKNIPKDIKDMQERGWRLHTYQATGYGTDVKHYLLFERENDKKMSSSAKAAATAAAAAAAT